MLTTVQRQIQNLRVWRGLPSGPEPAPTPLSTTVGRHLCWSLNCAGGARAALAGKPSRSAGFKKN